MTAADLPAFLAKLSDQSDLAAAAPAPAIARDAIPPPQLAAWQRVVRSFAKSEGFEECVMAPTAAGLAAVGFDDPQILRFFKSQGEDELRHRDFFYAYMDENFAGDRKASSLATQLLYDLGFKAVVRGSAAKPLRLLMPLLVIEKTVTLYVRRLQDCAGPEMACLMQVLRTVMKDEARHVAGVGATCKALVAANAPSPAEQRVLARICALVVADMDRTAWWKPGLAKQMASLGLDAAAMNRDNALVMAEMRAIIAGQPPATALAEEAMT